MEVLKNDFDEDDEAMFECIERYFPNTQHGKNRIE
jgi:hypothetical protein